VNREGASRSQGNQPSTRAGNIFRWASWIPLATFVAANLYVDRFDGWGAWAAAPILLVPVVLSAGYVLGGVLAIRTERAAGGVRLTTRLALALAAAPCIWLAWRLIVTL